VAHVGVGSAFRVALVALWSFGLFLPQPWEEEAEEEGGCDTSSSRGSTITSANSSCDHDRSSVHVPYCTSNKIRGTPSLRSIKPACLRYATSAAPSLRDICSTSCSTASSSTAVCSRSGGLRKGDGYVRELKASHLRLAGQSGPKSTNADCLQ